MSRRIGLGLVMFLGFWMFIQNGVYAQVPVSVLLNNVRESVNFVHQYGSYNEFASGKIDFEGHSGVVSERATQCIKAIDAALAADVPASRTIEIKFQDGTRPMSLSETRAMCQRISGTAGKADSLRKATFRANQAAGWPKRISEGLLSGPLGGSNAPVAADVAKECISAIDNALASNHPGSTVFEGEGDTGRYKMTLSEAREMCVYVEDTATKQVKTVVAAEDATYEPFRKVLSGDKLRIYNERLKSYKLYGQGGGVLRTPEDYRSALLWCTAGVNRGGIVPVWEVSCWRFKGMTMIGRVETKSGTGETPSSAFR